MKKFQRVALGIATFVMCFQFGIAALAAQLAASVNLTASENEAYSASAGGHIGYGQIYNNAGSAGGAGVALEISQGDQWVEYAHAEAEPGFTNTTTQWGRSDVDYLFRVKAYSTTYWTWPFNPGRVATAYLYIVE